MTSSGRQTTGRAATGTRSVLLIAFHYPPCAISSGLQRTLSFSIHLRRHNWHPIVLSVKPWAFVHSDAGQLGDIPDDVRVSRVPALDATRHLAIRGRFLRRLTVPDPWWTWRFTAIPEGMQLIRRHGIDLIWSTYPIATAHRIGATLARLSGKPWVADFRDPMVEHFPETDETFPKDPAIRAARLKIEALVARRAAAAVFCTDSARDIFAGRYAGFPDGNLDVIPNGYEEGMFAELPAPSVPGARRRRILLHSGTIYPGMDRDPTQLFRALRSLAGEGLISPEDFELRLRNPAHVDYFRQLIHDEGVGELVSIMPSLPYREALAEMQEADALLVLQGLTSNPAVPAKLYEYLRARRPLIALVHPAGETAKTLQRDGIDSTAPLTDPLAIAGLLRRWLGNPAALEAALPTLEVVTTHSRQALTERLAARFDRIMAARKRHGLD